MNAVRLASVIDLRLVSPGDLGKLCSLFSSLSVGDEALFVPLFSSFLTGNEAPVGSLFSSRAVANGSVSPVPRCVGDVDIGYVGPCRPPAALAPLASLSVGDADPFSVGKGELIAAFFCSISSQILLWINLSLFVVS